MPRSISDFVTSALVGKLRTYRNSELMQIIIGLTDWMVLKKHWIQGGKIMGYDIRRNDGCGRIHFGSWWVSRIWIAQ